MECLLFSLTLSSWMSSSSSVVGGSAAIKLKEIGAPCTTCFFWHIVIHRWYRWWLFWWGFREPQNGSAVEPLLLPNCSLIVCDESNFNQYHFVALLLYIPSSVCRCNTICVLGGGGYDFVCGSMDGWMIRWMVDPAAWDSLRRQDPLWMMRQQNPQIYNTKRSMDEGNPELIIIQSMCHTFVVGTEIAASVAQPLLSSTLSL